MRSFITRLTAALCVISLLILPAAGLKAQALTPDFESSLASESILLREVASGHTLYEKQPALKQCPASLVKIMTGILALEYCPDLDVMVTVNYSALEGDVYKRQV